MHTNKIYFHPVIFDGILTVLEHTVRGDTVISLTGTAIRNAEPEEKQYKLIDRKGMYVLVKHAGKYFRLDYRFGGKRKILVLGVYPYVTSKTIIS